MKLVRIFLVCAFLSLVACEKKEEKTAPKQASGLEVVTYNLKEGVSQEDHLQRVSLLRDSLQSIDGFVSFELYRADDGMFIDVVTWRDAEAAKNAAGVLSENEAFKQFADTIDPAQTKSIYGNIINV